MQSQLVTLAEPLQEKTTKMSIVKKHIQITDLSFQLTLKTYNKIEVTFQPLKTYNSEPSTYSGQHLISRRC